MADVGGAASAIGKRRATARAEGSAGYQQRRGEILAVAGRLFKEKGFHGIRLGDVAAELGTDRASLYYYVSSREELFQEIVRGAVENNVERAETIRKGPEQAPDKVSALIESLMDSYRTHFPYLYVYIQEDLTRITDDVNSEWARDMRRLNRRYDEAVIGIIEEGLHDGTIRAVGSARTIAFGLIGMVNWTHRWFEPSEDEDAALRIGQTFSAMLLDGVRAADAK
ncbi:TetR/AcrR family transcriptional regulator [Nocardioides sp.]|uniref:TetR/AcrR family transcriptional regulator n=1 Tax=Nocardioides sp. TaxID=35761 RepID=UPI00261BF951|nr:TetR/AcrR family transcriptional regulator [Nocardioides sp.]MCW2737960.1 regulatory protein TetR [Nocardioides sp.]